MEDLLAQSFNLIVCDGTSTDPCTFAHVIELVQNLITTMIILATFIATVAFAYAGFKLLTSGGNTSAKEDAKKMLTKVLWGYIWILAAWLIVYTIVNVLVDTDKFKPLLGQPTGQSE